MEVQKTIKFKLGEIGIRKQKRLDDVLTEGLDAIKKYMGISIRHNTCSLTKLHQLGYKDIRKELNLASCVLAQSREKATAIIKGWKTNKRRLHKNIPMPEPKALRIRYNNIVFRLIETQNKKYPYFVSFLCEKGHRGKDENRIYLPLIANSDYQKEYIFGLLSRRYKKGSADLVKKGGDYFIHIVLKKEVEFDRKENYNPIGVDIGINNLAVACINGKPKFFNGKRAIAKKKHLNRIKAIYQSRNNLKMLEAIKGKEQRYFDHINHQISSWIINQAKNLENPVIVMEDLTYIIRQTEVRKKQRYVHQTWAFKRLQNMIQYKALWSNIPVIYIQPQYTSQVCPKCLSTNKRVKSDYKCKHCGVELNADYVGAINITKKFWEAINFPEMASINNAIGFSFIEPQAMIEGEAKKPIELQGGCFSSHS